MWWLVLVQSSGCAVSASHLARLGVRSCAMVVHEVLRNYEYHYLTDLDNKVPHFLSVFTQIECVK